MVIISKSTIIKFGDAQPGCKEALLSWYLKTKNANWSNFHELKKHLIQPMRLATIDMYLI